VHVRDDVFDRECPGNDLFVLRHTLELELVNGAQGVDVLRQKTVMKEAHIG
jgi:hypothetical protein